MGQSTQVSRLSRRGFLGGIAASAAAAILAACGGSGATDTPKAAATTGATSATTSGTSAAATRPAGSAVSATAAGTAAPSGSAVTGTTAASSATSGTAASGTTAASSTGTFTLIPTPAPDAFKGQSLQIISRQEYFKEVETAFDAEVQKFAQITGTKIENNRLNEDTGQVVQKMDSAVKAGSPPDLAYFDRFVPELYQLGDIVDVSDTVSQIADAYGAPEDNVKINTTVNGKFFAIPYSTQGAGWFARKDWLAEKGIKIADIKTFENLRDAALAISDPAKNRYGWGMTVNQSGDANGLIQNVINAYGGAGASDDGKKAIFNSPETVAAVTFLADIYTNPKYKNMLPPGVQAWTDTGNNEAWLAGIIGFTANQFSLYAQSKATKNPVYDNTVVFPSPIGPSVDRPLAFGNYVLRHLQGSEERGVGESVRETSRRGIAALEYRQARQRLDLARLQEDLGLRPLLPDGRSGLLGLAHRPRATAADPDEDRICTSRRRPAPRGSRHTTATSSPT